MAEYKDIYYADSSLPMSASDISYAEAVSVGDKLEEIKFDSAIAVADAAARDALFPSPVQGDAVWRIDFGIEQRYFAAYHSKRNPGGRATAGWYATTSNIRPIIPSSVSVVGTGAVGAVNEFGEVSFSNATYVYVNNCFFYNATSNFSSYKVVLNHTSSSSPYSYPVWSLNIGSVTYNAAWQGVSAGANSGNTWSNPNVVPSAVPGVSVYNCSMELNIEDEMPLLGSSTNFSIGYNLQSRSFTTANNNSLFMLSGNVETTARPTTLAITTAAGTMPMTGTVKVYGIR